ncbi:MAG: GTPase HflX [Alphaproteobacteria bacterium]
METRGPAPSTSLRRVRALVIHPALRRLSARQSAADEEFQLPPAPRRRVPEARLLEAVGLAAAIDLEVVRGEVVSVGRIRPATYIGQGMVDSLGAGIPELEVELVVVDCHLSPIQQRNLERSWRCKVIDRTALILEIFGARARTREGTLQVELAHLSYQRSRLVRSWTHLERQRGGFGFLGGPGETQIETDRRLIGERIAKIRSELEEVKRTRDLHRKARKRVPYPVVALVGYTNAGKSTLFNRLTRADVVAADQLFATLDPTMRGLALPSGRTIILSDTVGFISNLPHELVAAFRATLEEVLAADVVVHVRDVAHPDVAAQKEDVEIVLRELGLAIETEGSLVEVLNKVDLLGQEERDSLSQQSIRSHGPNSVPVPVSASTGEGVETLLRFLDQRLAETRTLLEVEVPLDDGATLSWLYRRGEVVERRDDDTVAHIRVRLDADDIGRFRAREASWYHAPGPFRPRN